MFSCSTSGWSRSASDEQQRATRQVGGIVLASSGCQDRMPSNAARWARSTSGMRTMSSTDGGECRRTDEPCGSVPSIHRRHGTSPATENEGVSHAARGRHRGAEQSPGARALLRSSIPARLAYAGTDGSPRVVPVGFYWDGAQLIVGTTPAAPKVRALAANPKVALTIDTNT